MDIAVFLHNRMLRPLLGLNLLLLSLPLVLGGYGRNMFVNLGVLARHVGPLLRALLHLLSTSAPTACISPELSAWAPLIGFGTLAVARWDTIRT